MPRADLASKHFEREIAGMSERVLLNMYVAETEGDSLRALKLETTPGSVDRDTGNVITGNIRAMGQSDSFASGLILILDGTTLRTWNLSTGTFGTISGTVSGTDRAQMAFTQTELAILSGGNLYVSNGTTVAVAGDADFPSNITSIASLNQRILMTAADGKWHYTEVLDIDNITGLNFYTAESAPDDLIAVVVQGSIAYLCGEQTIEPWYADSTSATDPYSRGSTVIPYGVRARDAIVVQEDAIVFVDNKNNVRTLAGVSAPKISDAAITRLLQATTASDIICTTYESDNHSFFCLNTPTMCMVYDFDGARDWHRRKTNGSEAWDWSQIIEQDGRVFAAKRTGSTFVELSRAYATDEQADESTLGTDIEREFSAHVPHDGGRVALGGLFLEGSKGVGLASGDGSDPMAGRRISRDNGNTWTAWDDRKIGAQGAYDERTNWTRNGRGKRPQTVFHFRVIEPVKFDITGVVWGQRT